MPTNKRVVVGISGGVDSAVAAYLLQQQGYEVIGVFMQNWDSVVNYETNYDPIQCESSYYYNLAQQVCDQLHIPLHKVAFIAEYWQKVFAVFLDFYAQGLTPNPDVWCNQYVKFGAFLNYCQTHWQAAYVATGHYAQKAFDPISQQYVLQTAVDASKDQTYFLNQLNQTQLQKLLFPLGTYFKSAVRHLAKQLNLINWQQKDSMGICFVGKRNLPAFLSNYLQAKPGHIVDVRTKQVLGEHNGAHLFTIGQRKNLGLNGHSHAYYVCQKNMATNTVYVVNALHKDFYLAYQHLFVSNMHWINQPCYEATNIQVRYRHLQTTMGIKSIQQLQNNSWHIVLQTPNTNIACGQFLVLYEQNRCLGGGIISKVF